MTQTQAIQTRINKIIKSLYPIEGNCERLYREMMFKRLKRAERIERELHGLPMELKEEVLKSMEDAISKEDISKG